MVEPAEYRRPSAAFRWFARTPELAFRLGLGGLFRRRLCMLTHRGRATGLPRRTVLEVVEEDRARRTVVVASGFGVSQWLRNLRANPPLRLDIGTEHGVPTARELDPAEAAKVLSRYQLAHPRAARALGQKLLGAPFDGSPGSAQALAEQTPMVELRLP
ncbi:nitroreductase family deazaflavin-dependent oxidoreductase [Actinotalea sp.]|uniref:nitroreductase family deazaflavin-dependent oxidoreductase n=1 Tax=Actinotalea sp. TaxID=1872145 RepID=UPI0035672BB4